MNIISFSSTVIDLGKLEREKTHKIKQKLKGGDGSADCNRDGADSTVGRASVGGAAGLLHLLLTISGTSTAAEMIADPLDGGDGGVEIAEPVRRRYALTGTFRDLSDVGTLAVRVYRAVGLTSADLCGKSDPFCVLELVNARLQTHTEYKTLAPNWDKIFTL